MGRRDRRRENDRRCDSWQTTPAGALDDQQRPRSRGRFALEPSGREVRAANEPAEFVEAPQGACLALERIGRQARSLNGVIAGRADPSGFAGELPRNPPAEACWRSLQRHDERGEIGHRFGVLIALAVSGGGNAALPHARAPCECRQAVEEVLQTSAVPESRSERCKWFV